MQHSISVSVSGANLAEVRANLLNLASHLPGDSGVASALPVTEDTAPQATRKPRTTKAEKETAALANGKDDSNIFADTPPTPAPTAAKPYTKDDVNAAVQGVLNKVGGAETRKLLGQFGATSTGGVKVEDYGKLIAACEKLAA